MNASSVMRFLATSISSFFPCLLPALSSQVSPSQRVDPVADLEIIHNELRLKDSERMAGVIEAISKNRAMKKEQLEELETAKKIQAWLLEGKDVRYEVHQGVLMTSAR